MRKFLPYFLIGKYHFFLALLGAFLYRFPSKKIKIIGVIGTNGKSTTIDLIAGIFKEAGYKTASLSSIKFKIGEKERRNELRMTMPGRMILQKFLRQAVDAGCEYAILEVTSEGIKQHRHRFIDFDVAVFTNLSPEHIEAHGSFEKYREAKGRFFRAVKGTHIVNLDDENAEYFLQFPAKEKYGYHINSNLKSEPLAYALCNCFAIKQISPKQNKFATGQAKPYLKSQNLNIIEAEKNEVLPTGVRFFVKEKEFNLKLLGKFNIYNALAAICVALSQGIDLETCKNGLEKVKGIPGRMELVVSVPFYVFVDYAFTPNALEQVYTTITNLYKLSTNNANIREISGQTRADSRKKMICVLGSCGGSRDKWKRPVLGKLAAQYCDQVIITNEDPYNENPLKIVEDIESGFSQIPNSKFQIPKYEKILDRREAIRKALSLAESRDVVVITGKGCEPSICVAGGKRIPWDDRKVVKEEFQKLKNI